MDGDVEVNDNRGDRATHLNAAAVKLKGNEPIVIQPGCMQVVSLELVKESERKHLDADKTYTVESVVDTPGILVARSVVSGDFARPMMTAIMNVSKLPYVVRPSMTVGRVSS